jgi:hypothetical protein
MGVPTSEVGYTTAMPRREDHEVHTDMWWHWIKKTPSNKTILLVGINGEEVLKSRIKTVPIKPPSRLF